MVEKEKTMGMRKKSKVQLFTMTRDDVTGSPTGCYGYSSTEILLINQAGNPQLSVKYHNRDLDFLKLQKCKWSLTRTPIFVIQVETGLLWSQPN